MYNDIHTTTGETIMSESTTKETIKRGLVKVLINAFNESDLTQVEFAKKLQTYQPVVSRLLNGDNSVFSIDQLLTFLDRLDNKVLVCISTKKFHRFPIQLTHEEKKFVRVIDAHKINESIDYDLLNLML